MLQHKIQAAIAIDGFAIHIQIFLERHPYELLRKPEFLFS